MVEYTEEQKEALEAYDNLRHRLNDTVYLIEFLKIYSEADLKKLKGTPYELPTDNLETLKQQTREAREHCIDLNINVV